jgi:hypothetical protein
MHIKTLASVARISNLPTVWTNVLAAAIVSQANGSSLPEYDLLIFVMLALSLLYIAGMFLNDAYDSEWDKSHNKQRPIVSGEISRRSVWVIGWSLLLIGSLLLISQQNKTASIATVILASAIILYNALHKKFPAAAFIMGLTRFGVYFISAALLAQIDNKLLLLASALLLYITGVTYLARQEQDNKLTRYWPVLLLCAPLLATISSYQLPVYWLFAALYSGWVFWQLKTKLFAVSTNIGAAIGSLLAAIPLIDALYLASIDALPQATVCFAVFLLIPRLHKIVSGT